MTALFNNRVKAACQHRLWGFYSTSPLASSDKPAQLNYLFKPAATRLVTKPPLLVLHGLFGNATNWRTISSKFAEEGSSVYSVDLRNHGTSEHRDEMNYVGMANDILHFLQERQLDSIDILAHSMGGKVAMAFTLLNPHMVRKLCVVDIAPVLYGSSETSTTRSTMMKVLKAIDSFSTSGLKSRKDADSRMQQYIPELGLRQFILQNLVRNEELGFDEWKWRMNTSAIRNNMANLTDFAVPMPPGQPFSGSTLFMKGEKSNYIRDEHIPTITGFFPSARVQVIPGAGHWIHAEQPALFIEHATEFFNTLTKFTVR